MMAMIRWEIAVLLVFRLSWVVHDASLSVCAPFLSDVLGSMWNSLVSVPDDCLLYYIYLYQCQRSGRQGLLLKKS